MANSTLDLRVAGTKDAILMVEAGADEIPEDTMVEALRLAHESIQDVIRMQIEMAAQVGKPKICLLYTSDAADERSSVDLGGRRLIKKKKREIKRTQTSNKSHTTK